MTGDAVRLLSGSSRYVQTSQSFLFRLHQGVVYREHERYSCPQCLAQTEPILYKDTEITVAPYNEIYDATDAKRPAYAALEARSNVDVTQPSVSLVEKLRQRGIMGIEGHYSIPLVLDPAHFSEVIAPGVLQRAFALQALFADIAMGAGKIVSGGLLSEDDLNHILRTEGATHPAVRRQWKGQSRDQIRFVYAPDLVRDPSGRWVVLEDNVGCVGGVAAGRVVLDTYLEAAGLPPHHASAGRSDLERVVLAFLDRVGLRPSHGNLYGIPGVPCHGPGPAIDFETDWKANTLESLGMVVAQPDELLEGLATRGADPAAIFNLSATLTPDYQRLANRVFADRDIPVFGAPSVGLIASKSFHSLGNALISLYLNESSRLGAPPTQLWRDVPTALPEEGVLKRTNGCQGTEVFFLDEVDDERALLDLVREWGPCGAVLQEWISRSVLAPMDNAAAIAASVEIRPIVYVIGWRTAIVGDCVTARAIPTGGNRYGNISRGAQYLPVLFEPVTSHACP